MVEAKAIGAIWMKGDLNIGWLFTSVGTRPPA